MKTHAETATLRWWLLTVALILATAFVQAAPAPTPSGAAADGDKRVTMNMRDADIRTLIQWIADVTGKNFVVHKDVKGPVTVISKEPVTPDEAYQLFLQVLQVHGYAAVQTGAAIKIVPTDLARSSAGENTPPRSADMVVGLIRLHNVPALQVANQLKPLVSTAGLITAYPNGNSIIVADHAANVERLRHLIGQIDSAGQLAFNVVHLENADAVDVARSISGLLPGGAAGGEGAGSAANGVAMTVDERSNSILIAGDPVQRRQIRGLIHELDRPLAGEENTQVIYLHYVQADEIAKILQGLVPSMQKGDKTKQSDISIEPSKSANAVVINAPPSIQTRLARVVDQLDIRRAQVLVEALIVEVREEDANNLGVSWVTGSLNNKNAEGVFGANSTLGQLGIANITSDSSGNITNVTPGSGLTFGYLKNGDLRAVIRALTSNNRANILSTPSIVALDNEKATLLVGQNVPFRTGESTSAASPTTNPFVTIERKDIGTQLDITPRINQGDSVTLKIDQSTEDIAINQVAGAADLVTNKRQITTSALVRDGEILVVGGLISNNETETHEKVPFLGDIPLLGKLFSGSGKQKIKTNLMVFIHPIILKDQMQMADITRRRYEFMRERQHQFNSHRAGAGPSEPPELPSFDEYHPQKPAPGAPQDAQKPAPQGDTGKATKQDGPTLK